MKTLARILCGLLATAGAAALVGAGLLAVGGVSARPDPSGAEIRLARAARHLLIPRAARDAGNPLVRTVDVLATGRRHFADHCASCHGNDGKGETELGRGLYPRAPDMTLPATQELSDGELFWIIENGVRLTGMPAWGSPEPGEDAESWELVHFIRHLPQVTAEELEEMEDLNPKSREELEQEEAMRRFLAGEADEPPATTGEHEH